MRLLLFVFFVTLCGRSMAAPLMVGGRCFERAADEVGPRGQWVVYEQGVPHDEGTRRWLTKKVLVEMEAGQEGMAELEVAGMTRWERRGSYAVVEFDGGPEAAIRGAQALGKVRGVKAAEPMLARQLQRRWLPNDPLFAYDAGEAGYQWHLQNSGDNEGEAGADINVVPAWDQFRGGSVTIAIVDDGLEVSHPDLAANVDLLRGYDFNDGDADPSPGEDDHHGTACAGVAAAVGNNGIGVTGVAPEATLVGLRLIAAPTTDAEEADAFAYGKDTIAIKSNSWGPYDGAFGMGGPGPLSAAALEDAAMTGRGGKGTVFLWAAGNGNATGDDSNYDGWASSPYAIAVSAVNDRGRQSWYSEPGANILVCAPSNGGSQGITTTDRSAADGYNEGDIDPEFPDLANPDYTNRFGGTSSATPTVAGVVALMLEANPALTYRDVQEILVRTAAKNDEYDGDWITNGAGFDFNINYGAGRVDADAATALAVGWTNLPPRQSLSLTAAAIDLAIPDYDFEGVSHTFTVLPAENLRLEHVTVRVKAVHGYRGQLEWRLVSPSGISVRLARARGNDTGKDLEWTFMATHFWGERAEGDWRLEVRDRGIGDVGVLEEATVTFYGIPDDSGLPLPVITSGLTIVGREGMEMNHQVTASHFATAFDASGLPDGVSINPATGLISGMPTGPFGAYGILSATNASGTTSEFALFFVLAADPLLSLALEQPEDLKIVPFGYSDFEFQTTVTHDGVDAAKSGPVGHDEYSGMEFTVEGPATMSFRWKVSSEKNYDYLVLTVDGFVKAFISGEVDWTQVTHDLGPGLHNVDLYYIKDQAVEKGEDAGWVDELVIAPVTTPPVITVETIHAYEGVPFRFPLKAAHAPERFGATGLPAGLSLHEPTGLIYGQVEAMGSYSVVISATNTFGTDSQTLVMEVEALEVGLAKVMDAPEQVVATSGDLPWVPQWQYASDGEDSARSGAVGDGQESIMTTSVTGPCKVAFFWGVSSEADYDFLRFSIDGVEMDAISGEVGWTRKGFLIGAGEHILTWSYAKDDFTRSGLDSGFVDDFAVHYDVDGDGHYTDMEEHFGTSDEDSQEVPHAVVRASGGSFSVVFPSVAGNDYIVKYSDDLRRWRSVIVSATEAMTTWTDPGAEGRSHRFYKVGLP